MVIIGLLMSLQYILLYSQLSLGIFYSVWSLQFIRMYIGVKIYAGKSLRPLGHCKN